MKKAVIIGTFFCTLFLSNITQAYYAALTTNKDFNIKNDITKSLTTLNELTSNPSSVALRKLYISQLNKITNDFNSLSANESELNSKDNLNYLALVFMDLFNKQHKTGLDVHNNWGSNLFTDINNESMTYKRVSASPNNRGTENISVDINYVEQLPMSKYKLDFETSTFYIVTRQSDNQVVNTGYITELPGHIVVADGFVININQGNIFAKDRFIISPLKNAAKSIKVTIPDPELLALAWPVVATNNYANKSMANIAVAEITDVNNNSFSIAHQLNPPVRVTFTTTTSYMLVNGNTGALIEGPISYDQAYANIFPTPSGYDPGYRVTLAGIPNPGDQFNIDYNLHSIEDNRNGLALKNLYSVIASKAKPLFF
jgi:flagellar hook-associated protein 1